MPTPSTKRVVVISILQTMFWVSRKYLQMRKCRQFNHWPHFYLHSWFMPWIYYYGGWENSISRDSELESLSGNSTDFQVPSRNIGFPFRPSSTVLSGYFGH